MKKGLLIGGAVATAGAVIGIVGLGVKYYNKSKKNVEEEVVDENNKGKVVDVDFKETKTEETKTEETKTEETKTEETKTEETK